jgi:2,4-dienoyl-CoA reductase-like NADH-dependent reductase (Old Yellow Enzyme family)
MAAGDGDGDGASGERGEAGGPGAANRSAAGGEAQRAAPRLAADGHDAAPANASEQPAPVVRHALPTPHWPTADEAARARLFKKGRIGPATTTSRTWVPAMVPWRATDDGFVTDDVLDWYGRFADGAPGVLVVEATGIRDVPSGPLLRVGHDRFVPGLRRLADVVRARSGGRTRLLLQILDFLAIRRRPEPAKYCERFLVVTPELVAAAQARLGAAAAADDASVRAALAAADDATLRAVLSPRAYRDLAYGAREEVNDLHLPHVRELPRTLPPLFAAAAARAEAAGFDGVELHFAHAYTMASFLSRTNVRDDGYGGSLAARQRLPLEVFAAVQRAVSPQCVVGARFLGDEAIAGGSDVADAADHAVAFARAGLHFLSISKGGKFDDAKQPNIGEAAYPYTGPSGHECMPTVRSDARGPFGRNVPIAAAIRAAVRAAGCDTPVVAAGGICDFGQAEGILARGDADYIAAARQSLADPDWWEKMRLGRGAEVRRCKFTNYCEGLDQKHKQVTCQLWDREFDAAGEDPASVKRSSDGKRRLVAPKWQRGVLGG